MVQQVVLLVHTSSIQLGLLPHTHVRVGFLPNPKNMLGCVLTA